MTIEEYALLAKKRIEAGYQDTVKEWAEANYNAPLARWLTEEITARYGEQAERR